MKYKSVNTSTEVWKKLHELRIDFEVKTIDDTIREVMKMAGIKVEGILYDDTDGN